MGDGRWLLPVASVALVGSQVVAMLAARGLAASTAARVADVLPLVGALVLGTALLLALVHFWRGRRQPEGLLATVIATGLAMRLVHFGQPPLLEDDHHRYLLDGALLAQGRNPYAHAPSEWLADPTRLDPTMRSLAMAGAASIASINFPELRSIYPGTAQALFAAAHLLAPWSLDGLRAIMLLGESVTLLLMLALLRRLALPLPLAGIVWCHPLLAFTLTGQAHGDAWLPPFILGGLLATLHARPALAGGLLALAAGVKLWPALLAPLFFRAFWPRRRAVLAGTAAGVSVALVVLGPLLLSSLAPGSGLAAYGAGWANNNAPFAWASYATTAVSVDGAGDRLLRLGLAAVLVAFALTMAWRPLPAGPAVGPALAARACLVAAAAFAVAPAQFPWYAAGLVPLAVLARQPLLVLASLPLGLYWLFFPLALAGQRDVLSYGLAWLHAVPLWLGLLAGLRRQR